eukprot:gene175-979_t
MAEEMVEYDWSLIADFRRGIEERDLDKVSETVSRVPLCEIVHPLLFSSYSSSLSVELATVLENEKQERLTVYRDKPEVVQWFLTHRANPDLKNRRGQTPLQLANELSHERCIELLVARDTKT